MATKFVEINNTDPIINSKTIEKEIIYHEERIRTLMKLRDDFPGAKGGFPGTAANWFAGVPLIRDDFFLEHAKAIAAEASDMNVWPLQYINWEEAVEALKEQYVPIDFAGVTYWTKKLI